MTSPTVIRRQLGQELRALREGAGRELKDAAEALNCSPSRVSRIERAVRDAKAKAVDVERLCALYGADDRTAERLQAMLVQSQKPGWWESWTLPRDLEMLVGLEAAATQVRAWEPLLVPGLLQRPDYARAVITSSGTHRPSETGELVRSRELRQQVLTRADSPVELWAILDEGVLRRPLGGKEVMRDQLSHLAEMAKLPHITLQVVPLQQEEQPGLAGAFELLDFAHDPTVVYVDSPAGNLYLEKSRDTRRFTWEFDALRASALDRKRSLALIEHAVQHIGAQG